MITYTFDGQPVPYVRMTQASKYMPVARNYLCYQKLLAEALQLAYPRLILPLLVGMKAKEKKPYTSRRYGLAVVAFVKNGSHGDLSNYIKTVEDAIQYARIIPNDRQITQITDCDLIIDPDYPRIEIKLWERGR